MDFDCEVVRRGTHCAKWDAPGVDADVICMGTADMDFKVPAAVQDALRAQAEHGVYGYTLMEDEDWQAVMDWMARYHRHPLKREWLLFSPGVIPTLHAAMRAVSKPGDRVVVETPVYPPFFSAVSGEGRVVVENPLKLVDGHWERDWDGLEACFKDGVKVFFMCSPHNPVGRVWTRREQERLAELCVAYDVSVICDEIHSDLILPGHVHTAIATLPGMEERTVTAVSATKSFNLAGLQSSTAICPREDWRKTMSEALYSCGMHGPNVMAKVAQTAAYRSGRPWLEAMLAYVDISARRMVKALCECGFPATPVEGTYLVWADGSRLEKTGDELIALLVEKARIHVTGGDAFGAPGWFRVNLATTHANIDRAIDGLKQL